MSMSSTQRPAVWTESLSAPEWDVRVACDGALPTAVREDVLLLLTELVTNAVRRAGVGPEQSMRVELSQCVWREIEFEA